MRSLILRRAAAWLAVLVLAPSLATAEPYLAVQQGYACSACHVSATGGGLRTDVGIVFAENVLPARTLPDAVARWNGRVGDFLRLGGDLRSDWSKTDVRAQPSARRSQLEQFRVYGAVDAIPERLTLYVDEQLAPGNAQVQEAYVRLGAPTRGWYAQAGKFYLPFGWRLQDGTAFVREVSGINMATPDSGAAVGYDRGPWSAQLAITNGIANATSGRGHQATLYGVYVTTRGRLGASVSETHADAGDRQAYALVAGLRTGAVAWLGEIDAVRDAGFAGGTRTLAAALGEANWSIARGHNLKLTAEWFDPDRHLDEDERTRFSVVYELTPIPFLQLRAGWRRSRGIPQSDTDHRQLAFVEAHAYF